MDGNWRQAPRSTDSASGDWRAQLHPDARQRIVNKIMETLKRHIPVTVPEGLNELIKIAITFEEKIYTAATSQSDYLRKISLKMLSMETKTQLSVPTNPTMSSAGGVNQNTNDPAHQSIANALKPGSNIDSVSGSSFNAVQQSAIDSGQQVLQNSMSTPQQSNVNALPHSAANSLQNNVASPQPKSNILRQQQQRMGAIEKSEESGDEPSPSTIFMGDCVKLEQPTFSCPICFSAMVTPFTTICGHVFCEVCIKAAVKKQDCPICQCKLRGRNCIHRVFLPVVD